MRIKYIKDTQRKLKNRLCKELRGKVFHVTSQIGYDGILNDKAIYPSNHQNIENHVWNCGKYFANKNCVSVVDLYNNTDKKLLKKAINEKYRFYDIHTMASSHIGYIFVLKTDIYQKLITWKNIKDDWLKNSEQNIVPHLESGIKKQIFLSDIEYIIKVETIEQYIDYNKILKNK
jgi:hypothetical protein